MAIQEKVRLVFSDLKKNSYKQWFAELHDDGTVISRFGAVGATEQTCNYGAVGKAFLDKKIKEKLKKGYEHAKVIIDGPVSNSTPVDRGSLADIAISQIKFSNDVVKELIRRLANSNVHKICAATNITFNSQTGLFQTPIGVVTQEGIDSARTLLAWFNDHRKINREYEKNIDAYLRLIPRNKGHRLHYEHIFPDLDAIKKESDVLDALANSLQIVSAPVAPAPGEAAKPVEQVFKLKMDVLSEDKERDRISKWFYSSNHRTHGYSNVKIEEIYFIEQEDSRFNPAIPNLKEVFHGSSEANVLSILKSSLKSSPPSSCAIAGKMWGCPKSGGIYGALDSSKSLQYSFGRFTSNGGSKAYLFVADFACGRMEIPKRHSGGPDLSKWDSVWAQPAHTGLRFDEIVCYRDEQVKLKYLIIAK